MLLSTANAMDSVSVIDLMTANLLAGMNTLAAQVVETQSIASAAGWMFWLIALVAAFVAFALGYGFGMGRRPSENSQITSGERKRMLELLHEIGSWTSQYSDQVNQYQSELGELTRNARAEKAAGPRIAETSERIAGLLEQFIKNNGQLQQKLDAAEFQLDQKTRQIECYLTEARTDGLTGLFNRRAFDQRLEELFHNHRRGGRSFVVALIDVDHFKNVNDSHGHQVGDQALKSISNLLTELLSDTLMVARFGGEEFAVIMDGPLSVAAERMDRFRMSLQKKGIDLAAIRLQCTISVGLSEPNDDTGAGPLVRRADEALYAAKNFGRNRVYYHDGDSPALVGAPKTAERQTPRTQTS